MRFPPLTPFVKSVLYILSGCFLAQVVAANWLGQTWISELALSPQVGVHTLWQVFTYPFVQASGLSAGMADPGMWSFLVSMLFFWWMAVPFEQAFGAQRTLRLMAFSTFVAVVPVLTAGLFVRGAGGLVIAGPLFSIWPQIFALIAAFTWATRFRGQMKLFGTISLSAKQVLGGLTALAFLFFLGDRDITILLGKLAGIGSGILYIERMSQPASKQKKLKKKKGGATVSYIRPGDGDEPPEWLN